MSPLDNLLNSFNLTEVITLSPISLLVIINLLLLHHLLNAETMLSKELNNAMIPQTVAVKTAFSRPLIPFAKKQLLLNQIAQNTNAFQMFAPNPVLVRLL